MFRLLASALNSKSELANVIMTRLDVPWIEVDCHAASHSIDHDFGVTAKALVPLAAA